jgi:microcompartment protein CcmK/EutM
MQWITVAWAAAVLDVAEDSMAAGLLTYVLMRRASAATKPMQQLLRCNSC